MVQEGANRWGGFSGNGFREAEQRGRGARLFGFERGGDELPAHLHYGRDAPRVAGRPPDTCARVPHVESGGHEAVTLSC